MASTTRVSAAAERRRAGNLLQASVADGMGFSDHATIVVRRNDRNSPAGAAGSFAVTTLSGDGEFVNQVDEISAHVLPTRIPPARSADAIRHKRPANATGEEVR